MVNMDKAIGEGFKKFDTTSVSDALGRLGIAGGLHGIRPVIEGTAFCGTAFTVHYVPCGLRARSAASWTTSSQGGWLSSTTVDVPIARFGATS